MHGHMNVKNTGTVALSETPNYTRATTPNYTAATTPNYTTATTITNLPNLKASSHITCSTENTQCSASPTHHVFQYSNVIHGW